MIVNALETPAVSAVSASGETVTLAFADSASAVTVTEDTLYATS